MKQVIRVVAMNFGDLLQLKEAVGKVLEGLLHLPDGGDVSVTFCWPEAELSIVVKSACSIQRYGWPVPQGISGTDWAHLVSEDLRNHLLSGNRFVLGALTGDAGQTCFGFNLRRV